MKQVERRKPKRKRKKKKKKEWLIKKWEKKVQEIIFWLLNSERKKISTIQT